MLSWNVYTENLNTRKIEIYDIFKGGYFEQIAKEIKKFFPDNKEEFTEAFRLKLMSQFWCRAEYEVVITSWPPYIDKEEIARLNIEQQKHFDKYGTYQLRHDVNLTVEEKIDIYSQLQLNWQQFIDYVWNNI